MNLSPPGKPSSPSNVFYAMPNVTGQLVAQDFSKYAEYVADRDIPANGPILRDQVRSVNTREAVNKIVHDVKALLRKSRVLVPGQCELEISHHYGLDKFREFGLTAITVINREYCKRLMVVLPGQKHPEQWHQVKDETYHVLYGEVTVDLDGRQTAHKSNGVVTIPHGIRHSFWTKSGAVIEEVSSSYSSDDSFYSDPSIAANKNRKTFVTLLAPIMLTIVWDVDDVLNDLMAQWFAARDGFPRIPTVGLAYRDLTANPPHLALGVERSEYLSSLDAFHQTEPRREPARPPPKCSPGSAAMAIASATSHSPRARSRPLPTVAHWVFRHFGAWIRCFGVVPSRAAARRSPRTTHTKAEFLAWLGRGDILIDDSPQNIQQAQSLGLKTLMPRQPWNQSPLTLESLLHTLSGSGR